VALIGEFCEVKDSGYGSSVVIPRESYNIPKHYQGNLDRSYLGGLSWPMEVVCNSFFTSPNNYKTFDTTAMFLFLPKEEKSSDRLCWRKLHSDSGNPP